ncbi:hypothetical protein MMC30_005904 [Trapelia coarctata]|nr:hypothetical protein [Trapelia coarctata]
MFPPFRWICSWSSWGTLLQWHSTLLARVTSTITWLLGDQDGKISVEDGTESDREYSVIREDPAIATSKDATPISEEIEHCVRASKGVFLASGASGIVELLSSGDVVKSPWPGSGADNCCRDITTESQIYRKLGHHPRLVPLIDWDPEGCVLTLQYMPNGSLKDFLLANNDIVSRKQRLQWVQEAAEGLQLLHVASVIHCDVEPKNFFLDANLGLRIADFSGSSLEGSRASACAGQRFSLPDFDWRRQPTVQDDLFGLGSTIYFIMTGQYPFQELSSDEVEDNYRAHRFPDVTNIECGNIIKRCWHSEVASAQGIREFTQDVA